MGTRAADDRPHILMMTHRLPHPPDRGDRIRTWHTLERLSERFDVSLACVADEPVKVESWEAIYGKVRRLAIEPAPAARTPRAVGRALRSGRSITEHAFYVPTLHRTLRQWSEDHRFDAALAVCSSMAPYLADLPIERKVVDLIDVDSAKWAAYADRSKGPRRWMYRREARRLASYERGLSRAHETVVVCDREAEELRRLNPGARATVARNGVDLPPRRLDLGDSHDGLPVAVFTGVLDYAPNVEGLRWFVEHVWPAVRGALPEARFDIVGRNAGQAVRRLAATPGVRLVGAVPSVRSYLERARLAVAPIHVSRGVQNKALEAMASMTPIIATPAVNRGVAIGGRSPAVVVDDRRRWIESTIELMRSADLAKAFGLAGRRFVARHYDWANVLEPLMALLSPPAQSSLEVASTAVRRAA